MSVDFCVQALTSPQLDPKKKLDEVTLLRPAAVKPFDVNAKPFDWLQMPVFWQPWQQLQFALLSSVVAPRPTPLTDLSSLENLPPLIHRKRQNPSPDVSKKIKVRKLEEDTVTASPVSGMFIKEESCLPPPEELQREADELDETAAFVEVSEESRRQIESIRNVIGDCVCKLCKVRYDDVFKLAQHRCPRIVHEEYNCPECDKTFSCPANLASHRRWHRPRDIEAQPCPSCSVVFQTKRQLRAHLVICQPSLETLLNQMSPTSSF